MKSCSPKPSGRTPFSVVGGFLGAGKTTFINHLLSRANGRYAVLVNDFGSVNIDAELIAEHSGKTLRLSNGCVCCSLNGDFITTVIRLLDGYEEFDHIFVEASGVSDPWAIAEIALVEPQLALNVVIILADVERIGQLLADPRVGDTAARQIHAADIILLNKADLVNAEQRSRAKNSIAVIKPKARIIETVDAAAPIEVIDFETSAPARPRLRAQSISHEESFRRVLYERAGLFDRKALPASLAALPSQLLRLKGSCCVEDSDEAQLVQWVSGRWSLTALQGRMPADGLIQLVGIGTAGLDEQAVKQILDDAICQARS